MCPSASSADPWSEYLSTAVLLFDRRLRLQWLNPAAQALFSISEDRARGVVADTLLPGNDHFTGVLWRSLQKRQPYAEFDFALGRVDGHKVIVDFSVTPFPQEDPDRLLVECYDRSGHQRISREQGMHTMYAATRESFRQVAHEVKNPLGGIRGAAQLLQKELPEQESPEHLEIILCEVDRLSSLVDRMLAGERSPQRQRFNIHELLEHVCGLIEAERPAAVELRREYDPSLPELWADRGQLVQVMLNLLRNALQAVGGQGRIRLRSRVERQCMIGARRHRIAVRAEVLDSGPGLSAEMEQTAFYPMIKGRPDGTGLGLSIAQSLARAHGGLIRYERRDRETSFSLLLPVQDVGDG